LDADRQAITRSRPALRCPADRSHSPAPSNGKHRKDVVVNLAHGAFAMIGGYVADYLTQRGCNFYLSALTAAAAAAVIGAATERTIYRPLYRKGELAQVLLTVGFVFVATGAVSEVFGAFRTRSCSRRT
jgi:branched-subunit amino acid ABC-type transport system permease component